MAKPPKNHGRDWNAGDDAQLRKLVKQNTPTPLIAYKMQRTEPAIRSHASEVNLSLKPTNKSPYNRQKR